MKHLLLSLLFTCSLGWGQTAPPVVDNGSFINSTTGWTVLGGFRSVQAGGHDGGNLMYMGAGQGDTWDRTSQTINNFVPGTNYTISYWVMMSGTSGTYFDATVSRADGSTVTNYTITDTYIGSWTQYTVDFTASDPSYSINFTSWNNPGANYLSDVTVYETPAPIQIAPTVSGGGTTANTGGGTATSTTTTSGSTSAEMNVAAAGSDHVFVYQGNAGADWSNVLLIQPSWFWTCATCAVTSGLVNAVTWPDPAYTYVYIVDANNTPVTPDSGSWYTFSSTAPAQYSSNITQVQQAQLTDVIIRQTSLITGNKIYLDQTGNDPMVMIQQIGDFNRVTGIGQPAAILHGNANTVRIVQGSEAVSSDGNMVDLSIVGGNNIIYLEQGAAVYGGHGGHYQMLNIAGNSNNVTHIQSMYGGQGGHYMFTNIVGDNNNSFVNQSGTGNKAIWTSINGNYNAQDVQQYGSGNHYLDITLTGDHNSATVIQAGDVASHATINLTNAGGASSISLYQSSAAGQPPAVYSIQQTCANPAGCSVSVSQGR